MTQVKKQKKRCGWVTENPLSIHYHDVEWGVPISGWNGE